MPEMSPAGDLNEILAAIGRINSYLVGVDEDQFCATDKDVDAVAMNLIVIGEAVRRLPANILSREPSIHWQGIIGVRNRIAHGYSSIQRPVIWAIVTKELPVLHAATSRLIAGLPNE
jgi:uncharacterized protein with HEPN domain